MYIAVYRWKVKEDKEEIFKAAWLTLTKAIYAKRGSLGSRLHRAEDGSWLAYAQWPDKATYDQARTLESADPTTGAIMSECIEESQPPLFLEVVSDFLQITTSQG